MAAYASYDDDSLLQPDASTSSLIDLPVLYPPSATPPFPHRPHVLRAFPPAIDPDLPPSDFDDTHSLLASPDQSRSVLQREDDDDDDDEDEDLDDEAFREKMDREILGEEGEMTREEEKVAKKAWELGSRILMSEAHIRATEQDPSNAEAQQRPPPTRQALLRLVRSLDVDAWRYSDEQVSAEQQANKNFVPYGWVTRGSTSARSRRPREEMDVDTARESPRA